MKPLPLWKPTRADISEIRRSFAACNASPRREHFPEGAADVIIRDLPLLHLRAAAGAADSRERHNGNNAKDAQRWRKRCADTQRAIEAAWAAIEKTLVLDPMPEERQLRNAARYHLGVLKNWYGRIGDVPVRRRGSRGVDHARDAVLRELAAYWIRRDWPVASTQGAPFATVAATMMPERRFTQISPASIRAAVLTAQAEFRAELEQDPMMASYIYFHEHVAPVRSRRR